MHQIQEVRKVGFRSPWSSSACPERNRDLNSFPFIRTIRYFIMLTIIVGCSWWVRERFTPPSQELWSPVPQAIDLWAMTFGPHIDTNTVWLNWAYVWRTIDRSKIAHYSWGVHDLGMYFDLWLALGLHSQLWLQNCGLMSYSIVTEDMSLW